MASGRAHPLLQVGLGEVEAEELPSEWPFLPYIVPASPAEPEHFFRVTMEPEQFADEVGRLQGLGRRWTRTWGPRSSRCVHRRGPCPTGISPWPPPRARSPASCAPRRGACSSSKDTHKRQDAPAGIHRTRRRLHRRDTHPHRQVCARYPRVGHDAWLPDKGRGADHSLIHRTRCRPAVPHRRRNTMFPNPFRACAAQATLVRTEYVEVEREGIGWLGEARSTPWPSSAMCATGARSMRPPAKPTTSQSNRTT